MPGWPSLVRRGPAKPVLFGDQGFKSPSRRNRFFGKETVLERNNKTIIFREKEKRSGKEKNDYLKEESKIN